MLPLVFPCHLLLQNGGTCKIIFQATGANRIVFIKQQLKQRVKAPVSNPHKHLLCRKILRWNYPVITIQGAVGDYINLVQWVPLISAYKKNLLRINLPYHSISGIF